MTSLCTRELTIGVIALLGTKSTASSSFRSPDGSLLTTPSWIHLVARLLREIDVDGRLVKVDDLDAGLDQLAGQFGARFLVAALPDVAHQDRRRPPDRSATDPRLRARGWRC